MDDRNNQQVPSTNAPGEACAVSAEHSQRLHARWPVGTHVGILPVVSLCDAQTPRIAPLRAACRDLSAGGLGAQLSQALEVGQQVVVLLQPRDRNRPNAISAVVKRCTMRRPGLFDIGLHFDQLIDIQEYVERDCFDNRFTHEHVSPGALSGRVVLVPGIKLDHAIISLALQPSPVQLSVAQTRTGLLSQAGSLRAAIIASDNPLASPGDLIVDLYAHGFSGKAILIAAAPDNAVRHLVNKLPFAAVVVRPFSRQTILSALGQALGITRQHMIRVSNAA